MTLNRPARPLPMVSIIPLVDVLLILLVFFMVTSTFLDLDMLPLSRDGAEPLRAEAAADETRTILIRIAPGGDAYAAGQRVPAAEIPDLLKAQLANAPGMRLLLLPAPRADVQALVSVLDAAAQLGIADVKVVRIGEVR